MVVMSMVFALAILVFALKTTIDTNVHVSLPSWVTLACNPSGGIKVMEHGYGCARLGWWLHHVGVPTPS
ncbi:hypothetical protein Lal_00012098 [Lupinus albus]|nr:hypothetical protein Lal_00011995 [Lupinus albus]KAF1877254.1 hypothetical protein Lal_00012025 [Lupinus albus]KAF1877270.1 hypothetical protein Lal_00012041 [Lupinus albus]KAF1877288.1 hypothetical protein Lal_00012059 [Lupinus albus]KAF1877307.1 hypothetical protein Lal_00012078 [Lupinus albus]